jgi:phosphonoacetate hydrolase
MLGKSSARFNRRKFLAAAGTSLLGCARRAPGAGRLSPPRVVVFMCDGLGLDYVAASDLPTLTRWKRDGVYAPVKAVMPTVTNANNASICCGVFPEVHGITGNSYFDQAAGREEYMESPDLVLAPTLFQRAAGAGVRSALLTAKKKTARLLARGAEVVVAAEAPEPTHVKRWGPAPPIYSREINYWVVQAAVDLLQTRPELKCLYVHTTDYPMHTWPPEAPESREHLARLDALLAQAEAAAPDAVFLLTADHGLNHKTRCWDLARALAARGLPVRAAISAERDKYLAHHRGYGGTAWVYLNRPADTDKAIALLHGLEGVDDVLTRDQAARAFRLMPSRIGELVVLGDRSTVFGELLPDSAPDPGRSKDQDGPPPERQELPPAYRSHGSLYESDVPLVVFNARSAPRADSFRHNLDLTPWLFPGG